MSALLLTALLSVLSLAILCSPPAMALFMLSRRLPAAGPEMRPVYLGCCAAVVLLLLFNILVSFGLTGPIRALAPAAVAQNPGLVALLFAWISGGLCVLLPVIDPQRERDRQI